MTHKVEVVVDTTEDEQGGVPLETKQHRRSSLFDIDVPHPARSSYVSVNETLSTIFTRFENVNIPLDEIADEPKPNKIESAHRYLNTYRLASDRPFNPDIVRRIVEKILNKELHGVRYNAVATAGQCRHISNLICRAVKAQNFERYKIVSVARIVQNKFQGVRMISSFLWDAERDNFAFATFENTEICATGIVYGVYYE